MFWKLLAVLLLLPLAGRACVVQRMTGVPLQVTRGTLTVPVMVNGREARFILDTGAERTVVTQAAVQRLRLERDPWVATTMRGVGGVQRHPNADPRSMLLGGLPLVRDTLAHDMSLTVADLPIAQTRPLAIDGLLGRDFLRLYDLDVDVRGGKLTLYQVRGCAGRFLPWNTAYGAVPFIMDGIKAPVVPVTIDRIALRALLDTGASSSLIGAPGMYRLGLNENDLRNDPADTVVGLGPRSISAHRHQFSAIQVGGQAVASPSIWVEPIQLTPIVDMLLGADWLRDRRAWISFATRQVFFAAY